MYRTVITIETPDLTRRGMTRVYRAAVDAAFAAHRRDALPRHFLPTAVSRYGGAYRTANRDRIREHMAAQFAAMTPLQRTAARKKLAERKDKDNRRPLYQTGRLQRAVTTGRAIVTGPALTRRMVLQSLPPHVTERNPGTIDKVEAIRAVHEDEEAAFARIVDRDIDRHLKTNTKKRRS